MGIKNAVKSIIPKSIISFLRECKDHINAIFMDLNAIKEIKRVSNKSKHTSPIKVGFIVQMAEIWDAEAFIYDAMCADPDFSPELVVIPPYNQEKKTVETIYNDNYFLNHYENSVKAFVNSKWISLKERHYDYVFLQRPYDLYLPEGFRSSDIVHFAKVCYIPYAFIGADVFIGLSTNKAFFRNVYFSFLESEYMTNVLQKKFKFQFERKCHRILNLGYPALIPYFSFPTIVNCHTITWTPRWSFDPVFGRSNFLKYKDTFIKVVKDHPECRFVFRPHPLLFGEIIDKKKMSQKEVDDYLCTITKIGVTYEKDIPLFDSMKNTDILITDHSSIIVQFFMTGRPVIYCESGFSLNDTYQKLKNGMYIVDTEEDFLYHANQLISGNDILKEKRKEVIDSGFIIHRQAIDNIINEIKRDFEGKNL